MIATGVVFLDAVTKTLGWALLPPTGRALLRGVDLRIFVNTHGPFGIGPWWLALIASVAVLAVLVSHGTRERRSPFFSLLPSPVPLGLLLGGGLANLLERIIFGRTTDLLILGGLTAVNVADLAVGAGLTLLAASFFRTPRGCLWAS